MLQTCRMKAVQRYATVAGLLVVIFFSVLWWMRAPSSSAANALSRGDVTQSRSRVGARNFANVHEWNRGEEGVGHFKPLSKPSLHGDCSMSKCFDYKQCRGRPFKVYVYPDSAGADKKHSVIFGKILDAIRSSRFFTSNPREACLFVPSLDTIDRDELSKDFDSSVAGRMSKLPYWNGGKNHILFNLFSGKFMSHKT